MNGLIAGKIISSAEGNKAHRQAFSRIYYSEAPMRRDTAILGAYLTRGILNNKNLKRGILGGSQFIFSCTTGKPDYSLNVSDDIKRHIEQELSKLDQAVLYSVYTCVRGLNSE
jgi:hypothetical protein